MNVSGAVSNYLPRVRLSTPDEMLRKVACVAMPVIAITAFSMAQEVEAIDKAECFENCLKHPDAHPLVILFCQALCLVFGK